MKVFEVTNNSKELTDNRHHLLLVGVRSLHGIGDFLVNKLAKLNIHTVLDLLLHLPYRFQDRTRITNIKDLTVNSSAVIEGDVVEYQVTYTRAKKRILTVYLQDLTAIIELRFFNFNNSQIQQFASKPKLRCFGEVYYGKQALCINHPEYQIVTNSYDTPVEKNLTPIYPSTEGISQKRWLQIINKAIIYLDKIDSSGNFDYLPKEIIQKFNLINFVDAIKFIHYPTPDVSVDILESKTHLAQQRLIFDELLANQLAMQLLRNQQSHYDAPCLNQNNDGEQLLKLLPFDLTHAQHRVIAEIAQDLSRTSQPMCRLLQGDVGSGKTLVAAMAALQAIASGYQVALMVPTEILATQHYHNLKRYFDQLNIRIELLVSKINESIKDNLKTDLLNNDIKMIIGTHALIQPDVQFHHLGLIIIDEQHRFGVEQRLLLRQKGIKDKIAPHQLTMTATPIPRTLAMTLYADMDYSVIDELPKGREKITTIVLPDSKKTAIIERIKALCKQGRQVYWVCTLIEESEVLSCEAAENTYLYLKELLSEFNVGLVHGKLKPQVKSAVMQEFKDNKINILVATTVIEVGVDVPNASLMVIENPERLGLSQLHQLRGRVGRGSYESYCALLYKSPLSQTAQARLEIMRNCQDGFKLAEYDLKFRGSGEILGKRQTGIWQLKIADLITHKDKLNEVRQASNYINHHYPQLIMGLIKLWLGDNYKLGSV